MKIMVPNSGERQNNGAVFMIKIIRNIFLFFVLICFFGHYAILAWDQHIDSLAPTGSCIDAPVSLERTGNKLNCTVTLRRHKDWAVALQYMRNGNDAVINDLVKDRIRTNETSSPIEGLPFVKISIKKIDDGKISSDPIVTDTTPRYITSHDEGYLTSYLMTQLLSEGKYEITVETLQGSPKFSDFVTRITLREDFAK